MDGPCFQCLLLKLYIFLQSMRFVDFFGYSLYFSGHYLLKDDDFVVGFCCELFIYGNSEVYFDLMVPMLSLIHI